MPRLVRVPPEDRLDGLAHSDRPNDQYRNRITGLPDPAPGLPAVYGIRVARCNDNLAVPVLSPFPAELKTLFDELTPPPMPYERGVRDFWCRVCERPVRVVYWIVSLFHHECFDAESVIEYIADKGIERPQ